MTENYNYLFQYLEKENIKVDKVEFLFQIQSHPNYNSILAIADALSFFNIKNDVIWVDSSEIELLPQQYIAVLTEGAGKSSRETQLYFIEQNGADYFFTKDKKTTVITKEELESRWSGVVLLVEKEEFTVDGKKNNLFWVVPLISILFFLATLLLTVNDFTAKLFFIFPLFGVLFSVAALKNLFGTKSELINRFCSISSNASCTTVVNSDKWGIFKFLNFSDISIVFFMFQFSGFFILLLSNNLNAFFSVQKILLFAALPVILLSIYYQKYVEKKWCPICLLIIGIVIVELIYLAFFPTDDFYYISSQLLTVLGFVFSVVALVWFTLKKLLIKQKELKEFQLSGNRFMRNYENFKKVLISDSKIELAYSPMVIGHQESTTEITLITSPFCGHCEKAHEILENILVSNYDNLKIKIIISANIDALDEEKKLFLRSLMCIYLEKGYVSFFEALKYWFKTKNLKNWIKKYEMPFNIEKMDLMYRQQSEWCRNNEINFTPAFFVNGYQFPKTYNRENLNFFVRELVEDSFFVEELINY